MKNLALLLAFTILIGRVNMTLAQMPVDIGIKGGLSMPKLSSGSSTDPINSGYGSRLGTDDAIFAEFHFSKHFSIQPQLEYSSQGGKKDGNQTFTVPPEMVQLFPQDEVPKYLYANYKSVARINYLMLPVLAKYRFDMGQHWGGYVDGGPFVSLLLSAKNKTSGSSIVYSDPQQTQAVSTDVHSFDNTENIRNDLHKANAGISGQVGIDYRLAK